MALHPLRLCAAVALLSLAGCEGTGCMPGDFLYQCSRSCGASGVQVSLPRVDVCVCGPAVVVPAAQLRDGGTP